MMSVAKAATCSICGGILSGFRRDPELRFPVYFCPHCEPTETMAPTAQVMPEAGYEFDEEEVAVTEGPYRGCLTVCEDTADRARPCHP
jgi:hypothetical protein